MIKAAELAQFIGATLEGDPGKLIEGPAPIEKAGPHQVSFIRDVKYKSMLQHSNVGAVITTRKLVDKSLPITWLVVEDPYSAFALAVSAFHQPTLPDFSNQTYYADPSAIIPTNVSVGYGSYIGRQSIVGEGTIIYPQVYIGNQVKVGSNCIIYPGVKIMNGCIIGNYCILHPGVVIGADGFGFAPLADGSYRKIPQMGNVELEDHVEVGANTCIDRATLGTTIIRKGSKLDNLIQVGHNVEIGEHCVVASQAGFAGSSKIGHHARIGGQAGFAPHITVAPHTTINAQTGVAKSVAKERTILTGSPAEPFAEHYRKQALLKKLQQELKTIQESILLLEQNVRQQP